MNRVTRARDAALFLRMFGGGLLIGGALGFAIAAGPWQFSAGLAGMAVGLFALAWAVERRVQ